MKAHRCYREGATAGTAMRKERLAALPSRPVLGPGLGRFTWEPTYKLEKGTGKIIVADPIPVMRRRNLR